MAKKNQVLTLCVERWRTDLREMFAGLQGDLLLKGRGRRWDRDFGGQIDALDKQYAAFLVALSIVPAAVVGYLASRSTVAMLEHLFRAPMRAVIGGFLTSAIIFLGSHVNRVAKPYPVAFKLMLRLMAIHPILGILTPLHFGEPIGLVIYGYFVIRAVRKTYSITLENALLFFGVIYVVFALLQLQASLNSFANMRAASRVTVDRGKSF